MFNPVVTFNNRVFIPKIVPLVYDDTLSYYEFLCKVLNKMNEAIEALNALGIRVDDLEAAVQQLQTVVGGLDDRLTVVEGDMVTVKGDIVDIKAAVQTINGAINTINTTIEGLQGQVTDNTTNITAIQGSISNILDAIAELEGMSGDISDLESDVSSLDGRVTVLESATFGDISVSPTPKNPACNMTARDTFDWEIVDDTEPAPGFSEYQIVVPDPTEAATQGIAGFRFRGNNNYGHSRLILKNFLPEMQDSVVLTLVFKFNPAFSALQYGQVITTTFGALKTGISCMYQGEDDVVCGGAKAVINSDTDYSYDIELTVYDPSNTSSTIENSYYSLNFFSIIGGSGYTSQGRIAVEDVEPYFMNYQFIKSDSEAVESLESRMDTAEGQIGDIQGDIFDIESSISTIDTSITNINNKDTQQDSSISTLNTKVAALEGGGTVEEWDTWSDVFDEASITPNSRIIGFRMQKVGKVVTFEIAGCHFRNDSNHNSTAFCLGTLRSGLRAKLAPKGNVPVTFIGCTAYTDGNLTGIEMSGDGGATAQYVPLIPNARDIAVMTLFGSGTAVPYTWDGRTNIAYSLNVNICGMPYQTASQSVTNNAFIVRGTYISV